MGTQSRAGCCFPAAWGVLLIFASSLGLLSKERKEPNSSRGAVTVLQSPSRSPTGCSQGQLSAGRGVSRAPGGLSSSASRPQAQRPWRVQSACHGHGRGWLGGGASGAAMHSGGVCGPHEVEQLSGDSKDTWMLSASGGLSFSPRSLLSPLHLISTCLPGVCQGQVGGHGRVLVRGLPFVLGQGVGRDPVLQEVTAQRSKSKGRERDSPGLGPAVKEGFLEKALPELSLRGGGGGASPSQACRQTAGQGE